MLESVINKRKIFFAVSGVIFVLSLLSIFFGNLNLGIDMTG